MTVNELIPLFKVASTGAEIRSVNQAATNLLKTATPDQANQIRQAQSDMVDRFIDLTDQEIKEGVRFLFNTDAMVEVGKIILTRQGKQIDTKEWVTPEQYLKRHPQVASLEVIETWIQEGHVSPEDIRNFPELNNLRMIRDRIYTT